MDFAATQMLPLTSPYVTRSSCTLLLRFLYYIICLYSCNLLKQWCERVTCSLQRAGSEQAATNKSGQCWEQSCRCCKK